MKLSDNPFVFRKGKGKGKGKGKENEKGEVNAAIQIAP